MASPFHRFLSCLLASGLLVSGALVSGSPGPATAAAPSAPASPRADPPIVLAISVDGLNPDALRKLGPERAPTLWRLKRQGASTLNARTSYELTITLPNHTGMVTSRRVDKAHRGHGVTWNDERKQPATVQAAAGHPVASIFSLTHGAGMKTGLFAGKSKFSLFDRSWPGDIDRVHTGAGSKQLMREVRTFVTERNPDFAFWHIALPDAAGHASGWMSPAYLDAVERTDRQIGKVLAAVEADPALASRLKVIVTADHGGTPGERDHSDINDPANYRIPFLVWGDGIAAGDLYRLNPDYRNPGDRRPGYGADRQPVRNIALGNVAADLLGLGPIPGSRINRQQDLDVS